MGCHRYGLNDRRALSPQRERHARDERLAIAEMLGHPKTLGAGIDRAPRGCQRVVEGRESVEAEADPDGHHRLPTA
jgi:hypothetical protein